ncbi:MAG: hypothetical protein O7J95_00460, partial [Planctomycetota bacterium]|nr:hypothetical protein [Planctomycetota bacterium]
MRSSVISACFAFVCIVGMAADSDALGEISRERQSRLRAIYERGEFRAKRFRANWLADSSGYTVVEQVPG